MVPDSDANAAIPVIPSISRLVSCVFTSMVCVDEDEPDALAISFCSFSMLQGSRNENEICNRLYNDNACKLKKSLG